MEKPCFRFRRCERLKGREQIKRVFAQGRSVTCSGAKLFLMRNGLPENRIVFTFARKYGNAVTRNRSRRLSREAFRFTSSGLSPGHDLVLLVYPGKDAFAARVRQLHILFSKAGLFEND